MCNHNVTSLLLLFTKQLLHGLDKALGIKRTINRIAMSDNVCQTSSKISDVINGHPIDWIHGLSQGKTAVRLAVSKT